MLRRSVFLELAVAVAPTVFLTALEFVTLLRVRRVTVSLFPLRYRYCMLFVSCLVYTSITLKQSGNQIPITLMNGPSIQRKMKKELGQRAPSPRCVVVWGSLLDTVWSVMRLVRGCFALYPVRKQFSHVFMVF